RAGSDAQPRLLGNAEREGLPRLQLPLLVERDPPRRPDRSRRRRHAGTEPAGQRRLLRPAPPAADLPPVRPLGQRHPVRPDGKMVSATRPLGCPNRPDSAAKKFGCTISFSVPAILLLPSSP